MQVNRLKVIAKGTDREEMRKIFIKCDVAKAEATVLADRDRILEEIQKTMPFNKMNEDIRTALVESARIEVEVAESMEKKMSSTWLALALDKYAYMLQLL